jgi:cytochrome c oxidase cbb3-type subunit 4
MSKIIKQYADQVNGIEVYPIVSLLIFIIFFAGMLMYVRQMSRESINELSNMPLDLQEENKTPNV